MLYHVIIEDSSKITQRIHLGDTDSYIRHSLIEPEIKILCEGEALEEGWIEDDHDVTIVDVAEAATHESPTITCLSESWQVNDSHVDEWQFEDSVNDSVDQLQVVFLQGSGSELILDNDQPGNLDDLVPKSDSGYATRLATLFSERNSQLTKMVDNQ